MADSIVVGNVARYSYLGAGQNEHSTSSLKMMPHSESCHYLWSTPLEKLRTELIGIESLVANQFEANLVHSTNVEGE